MSGEYQDRLADFTRDRRILVTSSLAVVIGVASAFVAWALVWLINVFTNLFFYQRLSAAAVTPAGHAMGLAVLIIPAAGGLIIGFMARFGSEKIRGHGIPEALEAILIGRSKMDPRVAILKPLSSAISIGTGGPFGAEGPIIMTGGAFASLFAQLFQLSAAERKTLLVAGAAGGMSAIFCTPVAAVMLAVELLLFEWKPRSIIPVAIASAIAGALRYYLLGPGPIFPITEHSALMPPQLFMAALVGVAAGLCSGLLTVLVYFCEDTFAKCKLHWMWWPTIGGLFVGAGALVDPRVLGVGYDIIHDLLQGNIRSGEALRLALDKGIVWAIALGSGTSGGVLAPLLIIGGAIGAVEAQFIPFGDHGLWALLSMTAMMGGTMRSPITAFMFSLELTHDLNSMPALMISSVAAYATTVMLLRRSILTEKVARRGHHITREYGVDPLELIRVEEVMDRQVNTVPHTMTLAELSDRIARCDPQVTRRHALPITDENGQLIGLITRSDLLKALESQMDVNGHTVLEAGRTRVFVTYPDELLKDAVNVMLRHDIGRLPVVLRDDPRKLVGLLGRSSVMLARRQINELEDVREAEWPLAPKRKRAAKGNGKPAPAE